MKVDNTRDEDEELNMNSSSARLLHDKEGGNDSPEIPFCGCLSVKFYQPYFDVDTDDVISRVSNALFYCQRQDNFLTLIGDKPDAYGPIWVRFNSLLLISIILLLLGHSF